MNFSEGLTRAIPQDFWNEGDDAFQRSASVRSEHQDDEEALKWAALERLPTYDRVRKGVLNGDKGDGREVDVVKLSFADRQLLIDRVLKVAEEDNEKFLMKLRDRIDRVGIELPHIEVRFQNLDIQTDIRVGSRALPSVLNFYRNKLEYVLSLLRILPDKKKQLQILHDVSGIVKPRRMTLLLGPPSSGKTTLLLALSGKLDSELKVDGEVTYNGHKMNEFVPQRASAYISQNDLHIAEMTVRETCDFSARCQGIGTRYNMLMELSRREKDAGIKPDPDLDVFMKATSIQGKKPGLITDYVLKILGLDICADTIIGDDMIRGISGGQKKRVTTGEILVGPSRALFMDEISTGLDSSTTYQIIKCLRQAVHVLDATTVVSLLQPAPETYDLFDDIILLSDGHIVYQGPREHVVRFFESMGFKCPQRKGIADFLQEVTSIKDQAQYWIQNHSAYRYVPSKEFAKAFESFHVGMNLKQEFSVPYDKSKNHPAALTTKNYGVNKKELFKACFEREWLLMKRNSFVYVFKGAQLALQAFIVMTVYLRTTMHQNSTNDAAMYLGAIYFGLMTCTFNGMAELGMTIQKLPVFYKQRDMLFFPAWAYSLPIWVLRIPISLLESAIWVFCTYYVIGFDPNFGRFLGQFLLLFFTHQMSLAMFRLIAALSRDMIVANTFGSFVILIIILLGGFLIDRKEIQGWWIWGYWLSPIMYPQNALAVNEFLGHQWNKPSNITKDTLGVFVLKSRSMFTEGYWYWLGLAGLLGYIVIFNVLFTISLAYLKPLGQGHGVVSEEFLRKQHENRTGERSPIELTPSSKAKSSSSQNARENTEKTISGKKGMVLPFKTLSLCFKEINYYVDMPAEMKGQGVAETRLQLLKNVSGCFKPRILTCLMGVSGAGKTTLMDVLAGRKTGGYIEGTISISGFPKKQETFARISGYCEQNDIHSPQVTVYESLLYSSWLRLGSDVDEKTRKLFIEEVMELVELDSLRDSIVGLPGATGLSTEQRKRLTIAVELVANPSIIFMDEPTSGLDARAAAIVMRTVRNTVDTGRTVVCTIHQPSIDIFESFDELFLMKRGGQAIYAGPLGRNSHQLISYFQSINGVSKINNGYNPATWMLEVTSFASETRLGADFAEIFKNSALYQDNMAMIERLSRPPSGSQDLFFPTKYSQGFLTQCSACLWKQNLSYWRYPQYTAVRFFFTFICALLFGTVFWQVGSKRSRQKDLMNAMGALFTGVLFIGINNASSVQPVIAIERTVFYREKAAGMYSALPYAFAPAIVEIPYVFLQALIYSIIVYTMMAFEWEVQKFLWFFFFTFFSYLYYTYYGMMSMAMSPNHNISVIISSAFYGLWNLFAGFLIPKTRLPIWWRWYYYICPVSWTLYGLLASQFGDLENTLVLADGSESTPKEFLKAFFSYHHEFLGIVAVIVVGFCLLFLIIFAYSIKYLNFQNR